MSNTTVVLGISVVAGIGVFLLLAYLQIFLSTKGSRKLWFLLPALSFVLATAFTIAISFGLMEGQYPAEKTIVFIYLLLVYNIPTIIFVAIHAFCVSRRKHSRELDIMRVQDLDPSSPPMPAKQKSSKKWMIPFVVVAVIVVAVLISFVVSPYGQRSLYQNDSAIAQQQDTYTTRGWSGGIDDDGSGTLTTNRFTGDLTLIRYRVDSDGAELNIDYDLSVSSGQFKLVLVENNETVSVIVEGSEAGNQQYQLAAGTYAIKAVGKNGVATANLSLTVSGDIVQE